MSEQDNRDDALTGWDAGKAEAKKRFGARDATPPDAVPSSGAAAGIAEAKRRFGNRTKPAPTK